MELSFKYKERRAKLYVCEDCGSTTENPEEHLEHLQKFHPNSPALKRSYDRRIIKISGGSGGSASEQNNGENSNNRSSINSSTNHSICSSMPSPFNAQECGNNAGNSAYMDKCDQLDEAADGFEPNDDSYYQNDDNLMRQKSDESLQVEAREDVGVETPVKSQLDVERQEKEQQQQQQSSRKKSRKSPKNIVKYDMNVEEDELIIEDNVYDENQQDAEEFALNE